MGVADAASHYSKARICEPYGFQNYRTAMQPSAVHRTIASFRGAVHWAEIEGR
jgi:hypothetical protein